MAASPTPVQRTVQTPSGSIAYAEAGAGPVALFVHGVTINKHYWRHQLAGLSDVRRVIAVDLLAHGDTEIAPDQDVSVTANAEMLRHFLDALEIGQVDLVGTDSGGGVAQIFAAKNPARIRSLVLTNCGTHTNWPPEAFLPVVELGKTGQMGSALRAMVADKSVWRSPAALGPAYNDPNCATDADIDTYLRPFLRSEQRTRDLERFLAAFDNKHSLQVEPELRQLKAPALIVWGTDDVYFPTKWAYFLAGLLPNAKDPIELEGARIFFPEERPEVFNRLLREHFAGQP